MCGLVGVAGKLEFADERLMRQLLVLDYWRGMDSTGLAAVRMDNNVHIAKIASHPLDLFDTKSYDKAAVGSSSKAFIGHNRAATKGKVSAANAHPFQYDHIVGAHNGTLSGQSHKDLEDACGEIFDVDSQAIFACIAKIGLAETVKLLQGAWALTYVNLEDNSLNFLRNDQRPLWYAISSDYTKVFWASEYEMIDHACRMQIKPQQLYRDPNKGYRFWETEVDQHYRFDLAALREAKELVKPKVRVLKGKEPLRVVANNDDKDPFGRSSTNATDGVRTSTTSSTTTTYRGFDDKVFKKEARSDPHVVTLLGHADDPFGGLLTRDKFEELAKDGCSFCSADISWGDTGVTVIERCDAVLCKECSRGGADANRVIVPNVKTYM
jgi:predicted glutamine amidotransferase